jgi:hypothetical protein
MQEKNEESYADIVGNVLAVLDLLPEERQVSVLEALEKHGAGPRDFRSDARGLSGRPLLALSNFYKLHLDDGMLILLLRTAMAAKRSVVETMDVCELIWTGPVNLPVPARNTLATMKSMTRSAESRITVVGYRIQEYAKPLINALSEAQAKGVSLRLVIDRADSQLDAFATMWGNKKLPLIYFRKKNRNDAMSSVHAKLLIVDSCDLLVTSANLTYHGLRSNIEIGVRIRGKTAALADRIVNALINSKELEELRS